jgi:hypothetical protein
LLDFVFSRRITGLDSNHHITKDEPKFGFGTLYLTMTMMMVGRLSLRPSACLLLLVSFHLLVSCTRICSAFPVMLPRQQSRLTTRISTTKQRFGFPRRDAATLLPKNVNTQAHRTTSQLCSSLRNKDNRDNKDDVSINQFTSTSTTISKNENEEHIRKQRRIYQEQIEEMQRQRFDRRAANKNTSTPQELVRLGIACCFALLLIVVALKGVMPE